VQAYQPRDLQWSVETPLTSPRHKSCAVTIGDRVIISGGTMLGLGKVTTELFNTIIFLKKITLSE